MSNKEKYKKIFIESLDFDEKLFKEELKYQEIEEWDSIGHMGLVSALEDEFSITFETDDIIAYSSYKEGLEILKKYKIEF
jgi:acyl carrier protein|tara:strand:+ start:1049 stop:1288 length:240 start_codon:yes stop_codon:yes gene_type:complete